MSQTVITLAFERWKTSQAVTGEPVLLDEFVFANVPGLDPALPIDRSEILPPVSQIVHRQAVSRKGVVSENAVVHSVVLGADVGDFSFNWIGLINKASGTLAMIVHAPEQQKLKTAEGQQGNVLTRSFLMEYNGAQAETGINTPAETWQIDFTARMAGIDERQRLENIDLYGAAAFFGDGYLVAKTGNQFFVTKGTGYVAGLRASLAANQNITVTTKPVKIWLDVCWTGTLTSAWGVQSKITVAANLADYVQNGVQHYVFAVASIDANGVITDLRPKGTLNEQQASNALKEHEKSRNHPDATTSEKGFVRLSNAMDSDSEVLAATPKAVKAVNKELTQLKEELGTAAFKNIVTSTTDTTAGRTPVVGWQGIGGDAIANQNLGAINATGIIAGTTGSPVATVTYMGINIRHSTTYQFTLVGRSKRYFAQTWEAGVAQGWDEFYTTANKPKASDVDAVSATNGGVFNKTVRFNDGLTIRGSKVGDAGMVGISPGSDAASFDGANLLLQSWYGIGFYSSFPADAPRGIMGYIDVRMGRLAMKEQVIPGNYTNFDARYQAKGSYAPAGQAYTKSESDGRYYTKSQSDARYLQGIRVSATQVREFRDGGGYSSNDAAFATAIAMVGGSSNVGSLLVRYLQRNINGTWVNVAT
ncbi:phage tail protein [Citrobacter koseri]|uniref:phage tail-collar fiber domain-containing protein n=1 Tax=Citrobacter koseri TaxID=545 RepID=UPI00132490BF|nr:phage tail protein [Citrobacter koseri]MXS42741.1 hypothetical protein [Citrobacter koseri]DAF69339.1 MAG TPA: Tail fiber protein [Caudoviricetes sp.]